MFAKYHTSKTRYQKYSAGQYAKFE